MKYNDHVRCLDRNKRPCVIYLTQENDNQETMERIISYANAVNRENGKAEDMDVITEKFEENKIIAGKWAIRIIYRPKNSISTGDIDSIIGEIESEGEEEVKFLVHDYIKRIRPDMPTGDLRIDIGEAINEFSTIAKSRKIPIITANQLNREAYRVLGAAATTRDGTVKVQLDAGLKLDQSMISESNMLLENADFVMAVNKEMNGGDGINFLSFNKFKDRYSSSSSSVQDKYFAHPFVEDNGMRLQEDMGLDEELSVYRIKDTVTVAEYGDDIEDAPRKAVNIRMVTKNKGNRKTFEEYDEE